MLYLKDYIRSLFVTVTTGLIATVLFLLGIAAVQFLAGEIDTDPLNWHWSIRIVTVIWGLVCFPITRDIMQGIEKWR